MKTLSLFTSLMLFMLTALLYPLGVQAQCPVCTVAVAAGVGLSRYFGIDDTVSGVWMGALTVITALWLVRWLETRKIQFWFRRPIVILLVFSLTVWPLYGMQLIGNPQNTIWGVDKLLLGMILGGVVLLKGMFLDKLLRFTHNDKVYTPYQRVIAPVALLILSSLVFFFITQR